MSEVFFYPYLPVATSKAKILRDTLNILNASVQPSPKQSSVKEVEPSKSADTEATSGVISYEDYLKEVMKDPARFIRSSQELYGLSLQDSPLPELQEPIKPDDFNYNFFQK